MKKRWAYQFLICLFACRCASAEFAFEDVRMLAEKLAAQAFKPATNEIDESLLNLSYEQYQAIQFDHKQALWRKEGLPFQLEFFLPGGATQTSGGASRNQRWGSARGSSSM